VGGVRNYVSKSGILVAQAIGMRCHIDFWTAAQIFFNEIYIQLALSPDIRKFVPT